MGRASSAADLDQLRAIAHEYKYDVLVVPRPGLAAGVAATAWQVRLLCEQVEPAVLGRFVREFRNNGPERVPHDRFR